MARKDISNEQIIDLYFNKDYSCSRTAKVLGCDRSTIIRRIEKIGLERKKLSMSEHVSKSVALNIPIGKDFRERIEGELLGDGSIIPVKFQAYYKHSVGFNKKEYIEWLIRAFKESNIPIGGNGVVLRKDKPEWSFFTRSTIELMGIFKKWYRKNLNYDAKLRTSFNNRKNIKYPPSDLKLTSNMALHWYIGDGTIKSGASGAILCTHGFSWEAVEFLRYCILRDFGIKTIHTTENSIRILKCNTPRLLEIIGPCPVSCFEYKWDIHPQRIRKTNGFIDMKTVENYINNH